ncbi:MAG: DUF5320 domain-containing protein [Candidatus Micrarchaeota archaeon]
MPGGDGTGPWWGRGYGCGVGFRGRGFGRGMSMSFGRGFLGTANAPEPTKDQEMADLKSYASGLESELSGIKKRLQELEAHK